jgi:hypothetical protein
MSELFASAADASSNPVRSTFMTGSLASDTLAPDEKSVELAPISSESDPKQNARSKSPRKPRKEIPDVTVE